MIDRKVDMEMEISIKPIKTWSDNTTCGCFKIQWLRNGIVRVQAFNSNYKFYTTKHSLTAAQVKRLIKWASDRVF
jgi:hypothetical protein